MFHYANFALCTSHSYSGYQVQSKFDYILVKAQYAYTYDEKIWKQLQATKHIFSFLKTKM